MKNKKLVVILLTLGIIVIGVIIAIAFNQSTQNAQQCTLEARICPDGSTVGRTGPNCEFAKCPGE